MNGIRLVARVTLGLLGLGAAGLAQAQVNVPAEIHHIHGLATDRRDPEAVLIATHTGLVRLRPASSAEWLGEHRFDLMGFTAHPGDPNVAYASGHPDVPTYAREQVGNLGLLLTRDGGRTWQSVALRGHADFHALTYSPRNGGQLYGWNVAGEQGLYRISTRGWKVERLPASGLMNVLTLSAAPVEDGPLLAGTMTGLFVSHDQGRTWQRVKGPSVGAPVTAVGHGPSQRKVVYAYVHQAGQGLARSPDGGVSWDAPVLFTGAQTPIIALAVGSADQVVVATTSADVMRSRDGGRTWEPLVRRGRPVGARR